MAIALLTDFTAMMNAIEAWLKASTGIETVIDKNQDAERPAKPYAAIKINTRGVRFGFDDVVENHNTVSNVIERNVVGPRKMTLQVEIYTEPKSVANESEAGDLLEIGLMSLEQTFFVELFNSANFSVLDHTAINNLDEQLGERWERRAQTDLILLYTGETFNDGTDGSGNWIETAEAPSESNTNLNITE